MKKKSPHKSPKPRKGIKRAGGTSSHSKRGWGKFHVSKKSVHKFEPKQKYRTPRGKIPQSVLRKVRTVRGYKTRVQTKAQTLSKKYNRQLEKLMAKNYTPDQIKRAKKYRITGKVLKVAATSVNVRWSKDGKTAYVKKEHGRKIKSGKFKGRVRYTNKAFGASMRMVLYNARIGHYRALYGLSLKEAQALYRSLKDEKFGAAIFKALY